jgi:G3E family GTPase
MMTDLIPWQIRSQVRSILEYPSRREARKKISRIRLSDHQSVGFGHVLDDGRPVHGHAHPEFGHVRLRRVAGDSFAGRHALSHLVLPAGLLGVFSMAYISRMTRSFMLNELGAEYIVAARAKGVEPDGDRRQELVFIGTGLDEAAWRAKLESCLV